MPRELSSIVAHHEAGHAVMAMASGFPVTKISIVSSGNSLGQVAWQSPCISTVALRRRAVLVLSAGMAADFIHWRESGADNMEESNGHRTDRLGAEIYLGEMEEDGHFDVYLAIAIRFLERPDVWDWVKGIAELVAKAGEIDGRELLHRAHANVPKFGDDDLILLRRALEASKQGNFQRTDAFL